MKNLKVIFGIVILAGLGVAGFKGYQYYEDRYVGTLYYARVPEDQGRDIVTIYDASKKPVAKGATYELTAYNEKGESRLASFTIMTDDIDALYKPGTYLKISHSKQIVVDQVPISQDDIPTNILNYIK